MAWFTQVVAGLFEVILAVSMKQSHGFTKLLPSLITLAGMIGSVALLSLSMRTLPLGKAYTVRTGIGAVGAFAVGIAFLGEQVSLMRVGAAALIVGSLLLMKLSLPH